MVKRHLILSIVIGLALPAIGLPNAKAEKADKPEKTQDDAEEDNGYSQISIFAKAVQLLRQDTSMETRPVTTTSLMPR